MPRPAKPEDRLQTVALRLTQAGLANLRLLAEADRRPVATMARILVEQGLIRKRARIEAARHPQLDLGSGS